MEYTQEMNSRAAGIQNESLQRLGQIAPARASHVSGEMERLMKQSEYLNDVISTIEQRLAVVLRPETPMPEGGNAKAREALVPLADSLSTANGRVSLACSRLSSLVGRIEL